MPRPLRTPLERSLVGPAGEHYVLFRLYQQGLLASLAPPGSPDVDILVLSPDQTVVASIQVKTRTYGRDRGWHMGKKHESIREERLFYAFVDLEAELEPPTTYVVPSRTVAEIISKSHRAWLNTPGRDGKAHKDSKFRRLLPDYSPLDVPGYQGTWLKQYRESWDLLKALSPRTAQPRSGGLP